HLGEEVSSNRSRVPPQLPRTRPHSQGSLIRLLDFGCLPADLRGKKDINKIFFQSFSRSSYFCDSDKKKG
ncbi:hypothetical protein X975_01684, partial [Stegodyphus mimosarum]